MDITNIVLSIYPVCTDPVLAAYCRAINGSMTDAERMLLAPFIPRLAGTAGDHELSLRRAMIIVDGQIRQILPLAFEAIGLSDVAASLRGLSPIVDEVSARAAESAARSAARSAEGAAWSAARNAARSAWSAAESAWSAAESVTTVSRRSADRTIMSAEWAAWAAWRAADVFGAADAADGPARITICNAIVSIFKSAIELR